MGQPSAPERFEIVGEPATGGMAEVYRARDRATGEEVALKLLRHQRDDERFRQEAALLSRLRDSAIVKYIDHGRAPDGTPYLAMEWLRGEDLEARLARGRLTPPETVAIGLRVARALAAAHRAGVVHRDVKPSNVFLPDGAIEQAKMLDFGIARRAATTLTDSGFIIGTPAYMSPEQARGESNIDTRSDLFSLGSLLWECLVGTPAFAGPTPVAVLSKIVFQEVPRPRELRVDVPTDLDRLIAQLLAKDPAERLADGAAALAALERLEAAAAGQEPPEAPVRIGAAEQRFLAAILTRPGRRARGEPSPLDHIRTAVEGVGGVARQLLDGAVLVWLAGDSAATVDRVRQAARSALAIHRVVPGAPIVLVMGRADFTGDVAVGEVIDRAAALLAATAAGSAVRLDEATASMLEGRFAIRRGEAIELGPERHAIDVGRTLLGKPTPFVGRARELEIAVGAFRDCASESHAGALVVTGPPGIGKSRLAQEFVHWLREHEAAVEVWAAAGTPTRSGAPFGVVASLVAGAAGLRDGAPLGDRQRKLVEALAQRLTGEELEHTAIFLAELVGAPLSGDERPLLAAARRDPKVVVDHMQRAFCAWIAACCRGGPVVIVLEDVHWSDPSSVKFVDRALRDLADRPLFVLALARPEVDTAFPRLWADRGALQLGLAALSRKAASSLVEECLGEDRALVDRIVEQASGNAFFLEELIRAVAAGAGTLPDTVLAMATHRLEELPAAARQMMRAASVFGEAFWVGGVAALVGHAHAADVPRVLEELTERELVMRRPEARFAGETEYLFRHDLVREAAYAMLTDADREVGHRLAAAWLAAAGEVQASVIAQHHEKGSDAPSARSWHLRAAGQALEANDFHGALRAATRAIELGATGELLQGAHDRRGAAYLGLADFPSAVAELRAALSLVPSERNADRLDLHLKLARACFFAFSLDEMREHALAALDLLAVADAPDHPELAADATAILGIHEQAAGRLTAAADIWERARERSRGRYFPSEAQLLLVPFWLGDNDIAIERGRAFVDQARELNDTYVLLTELPQLGMALAARGRYAEADRAFEEARETGTRFEAGALVARARAMSVGYHLDLFDLAAADAMAGEALELARSLSFTPTWASAGIDILCSAARAGDPGRADRLLPAIAETVGKSGGWHGWLFRARLTAARAEIAIAKGDPASAVALATDVIEQSEAFGRRKYVAVGHLHRGRALLALGRRDEALVALDAAHTLARRLGDPALVLRTGLPLLEAAGSDELAAVLRATAVAIRAALSEPARTAFAAATAVAALLV